MPEVILVVGYAHHDLKHLHKQTYSKDTIYEPVNSPKEFEKLLQEKTYNCLFCNNQILDHLPFVTIIRKIEHIPVIIGSIDHCEGARVLEHYSGIAKAKERCIEAGEMYINLENRSVSINGQEIALTVTEYNILALLVANPKRVFTYEMLIDIVWNESSDYYSRRSIHNHVSNIKKKLSISLPEQQFITTVHGVGYKFGKSQQ